MHECWNSLGGRSSLLIDIENPLHDVAAELVTYLLDHIHRVQVGVARPVRPDVELVLQVQEHAQRMRRSA